MDTKNWGRQYLEIKLTVACEKQLRRTLPSLFLLARILFRLLLLSLSSPVCTKDSQRDKMFAGKVAAV